MSWQTIPPMTHELSRGWRQPATEEILVDNKHAVMSEATLKLLPEYSTTNPTGVYEGKMWKAQSHELTPVTEGEHKGKYRKGASYGKWYLHWYDFAMDGNPDKCSIHSRLIILL